MRAEVSVLVADGLGAGVELVEVVVAGLADDQRLVSGAAVGVGGFESGVFGLVM